MKNQLKLFTYMTKPFVLFVLLFALGVGNVWGWNWPKDATIYFDIQNCTDFGTPYFRVGRAGDNFGGYSYAPEMHLVQGTKYLYYYTQEGASWDNYGAFSVADNYGWQESNTIYQPYNNNGTVYPNDNVISKQTNFQKYEVTTNAYLKITNTAGAKSNNCQYYQVNNYTNNEGDGTLVELPMYSVTFESSPTHGTVSVQKYTKTDGSTKSSISTGDEVYPTQIIEITTTPDTHYALATLTVTGATHISGTAYYVTGACEITATFDHKWTIKGSDSFDSDDDDDEMGDWKVFNGLPNTGTNTYSGTISLAAHTAYYFKVYDRANSTYYGCGTRHNDYTFVGQTDAISLESPGYNLLVMTTKAGAYTFEWNDNDQTLKVTYPNTVSHPSVDYVYMEKYSDWNSGYHCYLHPFYNDGGSGETMTTWGSDNPKMTAYTHIGNKDYYCIPILTTYPNFIAKNNLGASSDGHETSKMYTSGHGGHYVYHNGSAWVWSTFQVYVKLENQGADEGKKGTLGVPVAFNDTALETKINKPSKTNYDFGGYYTAAEGGGVQIIDANGDWIANKSDYTSASGAWIHAGDTTTLYAKWTETARSITLQVSPSGAGSFDVGGVAKAHGDVINAYISTPTETITAIASHGAWKFKEWRYSEGVGNKDGTGLNNTVQINSDRDGTLTAVFEPRYVLYGSIYNKDDDKSGMPGWPDHSLETAEFEVNTTSPCNLTCERTLLAGNTYKFVVHDRAAQKNYGYNPAGSTLPEGESWLFDDVNFDVFVTTKSYGTYTFKINNVTESEGNYYPTVTVDRPANPHTLELGWRYTQIDAPSTLKEGDTGGTASAQTTETDGTHHDIANRDWIAHGSDITFTASHATGYSFNGEWYDNNNCATKFMDGDPSTVANNITDNFRVYVKFDEISTSVTLSATNGQIKVGDTPSSETTCGVTTTRSLTAVPNDGYYFTGWSLSSSPDFQLDDKTSDTDPEVTLRGKGDGNAGTLTANFALRYSLKGTMDSENWGPDHYISNIATVGGKAIGYVDITLAANTSYEFAIYDLGPGGGWLKDNNTQVYNMTNGNSYNWDFDLGRTFNCGITTAGAGTYRFMWNITDKTMSVIYPNFVIYRSGDKDEDSESATHTTTSTVESYDGGTVAQGIEFRMKVRELDKWYTLCLPFEVNKVCVWDAEDGKYYEMKPYYRPTPGGTFYTGHYVIRSPYGDGVTGGPGVEIELAHFDDWRDPEDASVLPSASTPYIIQWHHSYFRNRYISFFGATGQRIPSSMTSVDAPSANDKVRVCGNDAMKGGSVAGAYMLDNDYGSGAWLRDEDKTKSRTISPFECYILASSETTGKYLVIRRGMTTDDTPTGWDDVLNSERKVRINVYTISGFMVTQFNDCSFAEAAQRLRTECGEGIFILRSENESVKLMMGGK